MSRHIEIRRNLTDSHHFMAAELQAKIARFVGTHLGSPVELIPIRQLCVELLPSRKLHNAAWRALKTDSSLTPRHIQAQIRAQVPETSVAQLDDVRVVHASALGQGAMRSIALALEDPMLDAEAVALTAAVDTTLGISPPIHKYRFLEVARVGKEYADGAKQIVNEVFNSHEEATVSLDPLYIGNTAIMLQKAG